MTRIPWSGRLISNPLSQQIARDHHTVHFRRALADAADARLPVPSLERKLLADAVSAMNLHRAIDHAPEHFARVQLRDRGFVARVFTAVGFPRALPGQPSRGAEFDLGIRQHPLNGL